MDHVDRKTAFATALRLRAGRCVRRGASATRPAVVGVAMTGIDNPCGRPAAPEARM
jgi:hypothetical protein